jgi:hypothetical protein
VEEQQGEERASLSVSPQKAVSSEKPRGSQGKRRERGVTQRMKRGGGVGWRDVLYQEKQEWRRLLEN